MISPIQPSKKFGSPFQRGEQMRHARILLVDEGDPLSQVRKALADTHFEVVSALNFASALALMLTQSFDILITNLDMPEPRDGLALVTAMHHANPSALNLVLSGSADVPESVIASLRPKDILVKPCEVETLAEFISEKILERAACPRITKENVASILERDVNITIRQWLGRVGETRELNCIDLSDSERSRYLGEFMVDIVARLRDDRELKGDERPSAAAVAHGQLRYRQGYSAPMIVQESRILQVSIFETIKMNLTTMDFNLVLPDIMLIADEVDSQLTQSIASFLTASGKAAAA
jgi:DNA-binding NarL/FixJ family response regulator